MDVRPPNWIFCRMHDLVALPPRIAAANRYPFRPGEAIPPSWSASLHLVHVLAGAGRISIDGTWHDLAPGAVAALPWGAPWAFATGRDPLAIISIHLRFLPWAAAQPGHPPHGIVGRGAAAPAPGPAPLLPPLPRPRSPARCRALAEACLEAWHARDAAREVRLRGLALALVAELQPGAGDGGGRHPQAGRVAGLLDWLDFHPGLAPSRGELEARAGLGRTAFGAAFRALTGRSPAAWLMERRLAEAHRLLTTSRASVAEIAQRVGFGDPFHFNRRFRQRYGMSPREARQGLGQPALP